MTIMVFYNVVQHDISELDQMATDMSSASVQLYCQLMILLISDEVI